MLKSSFPDGMSEILIAATLWEVLQGLEYLHKMRLIHRSVVVKCFPPEKEEIFKKINMGNKKPFPAVCFLS